MSSHHLCIEPCVESLAARTSTLEEALEYADCTLRWAEEIAIAFGLRSLRRAVDDEGARLVGLMVVSAPTRAVVRATHRNPAVRLPNSYENPHQWSELLVWAARQLGDLASRVLSLIGLQLERGRIYGPARRDIAIAQLFVRDNFRVLGVDVQPLHGPLILTGPGVRAPRAKPRRSLRFG